MKLGYTLYYVEDVPKTLAFYEAAFGLKRGFLHESNQYGEMETGPTRLGFVQHETARSHGFGYAAVSRTALPPGCEIGLVTLNEQEVHTAYDRAIQAGAQAVSPPHKKPWGQVVSYVRDCNGFLVEICSPVSPGE